MMWKDDIQAQIEDCEHNIRFAKRNQEASGCGYWQGYIARENEVLEALKSLLPKASPTPYSDVPIEREKKIRIGGYKAW